MRWVVVLLILSTPAYADDKATAEALFLQAKELVKAGDYADACPLYEQSFKLDPSALGAEINLADCHEHVGLLASAWSEYHDVEDRARRVHDDTREAYAKEHGEALEPRLAKLKIDKPAAPPAGLVVKRDGNDVTAILGVPMPVDPGQHVVEVGAPGYATQTVNVAIGNDATVTPLALPALVKLAEVGHLTIDSQPDADISLDGAIVGRGHFAGAVPPGRHVLRVVAPGMHAHQSDVYVTRDENRTVDVPLDRDGARDSGPSADVAVSVAPGVKLHGDSPAVVAYRAEIARRIGPRVRFGLFVEYGSISASNACGSDVPGAVPGSAFDFGARNQFTSCRFVMPGLQLLVHILPGRAWDPYVGLDPGFRLSLVTYSPFDPNPTSTMNGNPVHDTWPSIVAGARAGVDYHPTGGAWAVGAFLDAEITIVGQEADNQHGSNATSYTTLLLGLRTSVGF